jgi:outer membrane protein TolC
MKYCFACISFILSSSYVFGQSPTTLEKLIEQSNRYYATNQAASFRTLAAKAQAEIIRNEYKPKLEAAYQLNYATYNNITGMVFPSFITPISGPPAKSNSYNGVFGSAAALLARWDVATFGYQKSLLKQAGNEANSSKAKELLQEFRQDVQLSSIYLDWLISNRLIRVYQNNLKRVDTALQLSGALTQKGLRPGTDSASWSSEYAKAKVLLEEEEKSAKTLFIQLQQFIGLDTNFIASDTVLLNKLPRSLLQNNTSESPELQVLQQEIENQKSGITVLQQSKKPLLSLYGTGYVRGSGVEATNDVKALRGLYFQRYNYGVGVQLSVPLFEGARTKAKINQQQQLVNAASEDFKLMQWQLQKETEEADTALQKAISIVSFTESQQRSADFLFNAVSARYKAGLVSYADVVLAQQQLIQSEHDVEKSRWEVWKALLYKASILGDLNFFTKQFR